MIGGQCRGFAEAQGSIRTEALLEGEEVAIKDVELGGGLVKPMTETFATASRPRMTGETATIPTLRRSRAVEPPLKVYARPQR